MVRGKSPFGFENIWLKMDEFMDRFIHSGIDILSLVHLVICLPKKLKVWTQQGVAT